MPNKGKMFDNYSKFVVFMQNKNRDLHRSPERTFSASYPSPASGANSPLQAGLNRTELFRWIFGSISLLYGAVRQQPISFLETGRYLWFLRSTRAILIVELFDSSHPTPPSLVFFLCLPYIRHDFSLSVV
jgi:hypothetical protein